MAKPNYILAHSNLSVLSEFLVLIVVKKSTTMDTKNSPGTQWPIKFGCFLY